MSEAKRRGRPPKRVEGADVVHTVDEFLANPLERPRTFEPPPFAVAFAKAVWNAQSPDEPRSWRLERVAEAMKNRGFSMEGIDL